MTKALTRRSFLAKSALALGTAATLQLTGVMGVLASEGFKPEKLAEETMPHISVKLFPGRSEETKQRLADAIVQDVVKIIGADEDSISVSIEDVPSGDWKKDVYDPEIKGKPGSLYKKPGYSM